MLGGEVLVVELLALLVGRFEQRERAGRQPRVAHRCTRHARQPAERLVDPVAQRVEVDADALEHAVDDALGLVEQRAEQVLGCDLGVPGVAARGLRGAHGCLGLASELVRVECHCYFLVISLSRASTTAAVRNGTISRRYC